METPSPKSTNVPEIPEIPEDVLQKLGRRYSKFEYVSSGATSAVYKVHDEVLDKVVALKILKRPEYRDLIRFQKEAQAASQLENEHLVHIMDFNVTTKNHAYLVMEFVEGKDLQKILEERESIPLETALDIAGQICDGMAHAHSKKIAHRDLKTSNIIVSNEERPKITVVDFGLAKKQAQDDTLVATETQGLTTTSGVIQGSPLFMSPEQAQGKDADERADVYALGCIVYQMISGHTPFVSDDLMSLLRKHVEEEPRPLSEIVDMELPENIDSAVAKALEKDPANRFQTMADFKSALLMDRSRHGDQETKSDKRSEHKKKWSLAYIMLAIPIIALALYALWSNFTPETKVENQVASDAYQQKKLKFIEESLSYGPNSSRENDREKWFTKKQTHNYKHEDYEYLAQYLNLKKQDFLEKNRKAQEFARLSLKESGVTAEDLVQLLNCQIECLDLSKEKIDDQMIETLLRFPDLQLLVLDETRISNKQLNRLWKIDSLDSISLEDCPMISTEGFKNIEEARKLSEIWLNNTKEGTKPGSTKLSSSNNINSGVLGHIANCSELSRLYISYTAVDDKGIEKLLNSSVIKPDNIKHLNLIGCKNITGKSLKLICSKCPDLTYLGIGETGIKKEDLVALASLKKMKDLNLTGIEVGEEELKAIGEMKDIRNLYLDKIVCGGEGLRHLYSFKEPELIVYHNGSSITKADLKALRDNYKNRKNFKLISPNSIITDSAKDLARSLFDVE